MPRRTDTTIVAVKLRIRDGLRKKLLREAERAERSLNQELERRLERSFEIEAELDSVRLTLAERDLAQALLDFTDGVLPAEEVRQSKERLEGLLSTSSKGKKR